MLFVGCEDFPSHPFLWGHKKLHLDEATSTIISVISAVFASGVTYGVLRIKVDTAEKRLDSLEEVVSKHPERYVTFSHFDAIVQPVQKAIVEIQKDIKEILKLLSRK